MISYGQLFWYYFNWKLATKKGGAIVLLAHEFDYIFLGTHDHI